MKKTLEELNVHYVTTSFYHPQSNGKVERFHRTMHDILAKKICHNEQSWDVYINQMLAAVRFHVSETTKFSPYYLLYNRDVILPLDNILRPRRIYYGEEHHEIALQEMHRTFTLVRNNIRKAKKNNKKQNGFRRNRSTTSQILTIRRILEGVRAKNLQATLIFVDFTKAFDSIHRGKMEQILLAYGIPKETVAAITILYRNTKVKVRSPDGDTEYFDIVAGVLQGDTLAPYLFIISLDYVLRTSIDKIKENGFELTKKRSRRYPATTITDADYTDDIAILANTPDQAETLLHSLERAAASIGLHVNAHKTEYMCYNQTGDISTLEGTPLKLVDKFTYLGSSVESTEKDIETRLTKAWTAINRLSTIWKSDLTDKMKRSFFQAAVTSILLYGCTTWTLTKRLEKKLDGNYTRMLRAILNKSWQQHPTRHQLYGHLPPITKTIQVRRTRHAGHCWRSRDELIRDVLLWIPTHGRAKAGRPARTYIQQLCEDTGCCPEDLPRAMNDREEWRERVRDIRAASAI